MKSQASHMIWIAITVTLMSSVTGQRGGVQLLSTLLGGYDPDVRPVNDQKEVVNVHFDVSLRQIQHISEKLQELKASYWYRVHWTDAFLQWNPEDHNNITEIGVSVNRIWKPDITHYTDVSEERIDVESIYKATIHHDGLVEWTAPVLISSTCQLNLEYFPWDTQTCDQIFGSWRYKQEQMDMFNISESGYVGDFVDNGEWSLVGFPVRRKVTKYPAGSFVELHFSIIVERRATYYMFNIVIPAIFISLCGLLVFWLPPDSGEKISLSVALLLASTVFMLIISEKLPETTSVPLILKYFLVVLGILVLELVVIVALIYIQFSGELKRPLPKALDKFVLQRLATVLLLRKTVRRKLGDYDRTVGSQDGLEIGEMNNGFVNDKQKTQEKKTSGDMAISDKSREKEDNDDCLEKYKTQWMLVVLVLGRLFFFLALITVITVNMVVIIPMQSHS